MRCERILRRGAGVRWWWPCLWGGYFCTAVRGIPFRPPSEVKAAVTGSRRADKASVGRMVARFWGWKKFLNLLMRQTPRRNLPWLARWRHWFWH